MNKVSTLFMGICIGCIISFIVHVSTCPASTLNRDYGKLQKMIDEAKKETAQITPQGMDYEIVLVPANDYGTDPDSIQIWDGKRLVGTVAIIENTPIANLIYDDNQ